LASFDWNDFLARFVFRNGLVVGFLQRQGALTMEAASFFASSAKKIQRTGTVLKNKSYLKIFLVLYQRKEDFLRFVVPKFI
jgi:hypothetical protein